MENHVNIDSDTSFHKDSYFENHNRTSITPLKLTKANYDVSNFRKILDDYDYLKEENIKLKATIDNERQKTQKLEAKINVNQPKITANYKEIESLKEYIIRIM